MISAFAGGAGTLDQDIVPGDDVLIAHGVAANLEGEDFAVADDVVQRDTLGGFNGFDRATGGDAAQKRKTISSTLTATAGQDIDGAAAIVCPLQKAFVLQIGDVFVNRGERAQAETAGDLLARKESSRSSG